MSLFDYKKKRTKKQNDVAAEVGLTEEHTVMPIMTSPGIKEVEQSVTDMTNYATSESKAKQEVTHATVLDRRVDYAADSCEAAQDDDYDL